MKGQLSAEFLIVLSVLLFIFLLVYVSYNSSNINVFQGTETLNGMLSAYTLATALNYVYLAGDGTQYNFTFSGKDNNENITISPFAVESRRTYAVVQAPILNGNTNVSSVGGGSMMITNSNGAVGIG